MANYYFRHNVPQDVQAFTHDQETRLVLGQIRDSIDVLSGECSKLSDKNDLFMLKIEEMEKNTRDALVLSQVISRDLSYAMRGIERTNDSVEFVLDRMNKLFLKTTALILFSAITLGLVMKCL